MDDKHEATQDIDVSANTAPTTISPPENTPPASQPATAQQLTNAETNIETRMSSFERATLRWTRAMFVVTTATALFIAFQWLEMRDAGKQTDKIIAADERLAKAMEDSVREAGSSLQTAIDQSHFDQRAWVGAGEIMAPQDLKAGGKPRFGVVVSNSGKTPALNFQHVIHADFSKKGATFHPTYTSYGEQTKPSISVLQPGMRVVLFTSPTEGELTQANIDMLKSGAYVIKYYGRISYNDVFGNHHMTTFCLYVTPDLTNASSCDSYNQAD
jgi:hypothetical protein